MSSKMRCKNLNKANFQIVILCSNMTQYCRWCLQGGRAIKESFLTSIHEAPSSPSRDTHHESSVLLPPPGKFVPEDLYARKGWRRVQYLTHQFWSRWRKEYPANITLRQWWHSPRWNVDWRYCHCQGGRASPQWLETWTSAWCLWRWRGIICIIYVHQLCLNILINLS